MAWGELTGVTGPARYELMILTGSMGVRMTQVVRPKAWSLSRQCRIDRDEQYQADVCQILIEIESV